MMRTLGLTKRISSTINPSRRYSTNIENSTYDTLIVAALSVFGVLTTGAAAWSVYVENPKNIRNTDIELSGLEARSDEEAVKVLAEYGACVLTHRRIPDEFTSEWRNYCKKQFRRYKLVPDPSWMGDQSFKPVLKNRY